MFIGVPVSSVYSGWILSIVWRWYVVPITGWPALSVASAVGVGCVASLLTYHAGSGKDDRSALEIFALGVFLRSMVLLVAWIALQFTNGGL